MLLTFTLRRTRLNVSLMSLLTGFNSSDSIEKTISISGRKCTHSFKLVSVKSFCCGHFKTKDTTKSENKKKNI